MTNDLCERCLDHGKKRVVHEFIWCTTHAAMFQLEGRDPVTDEETVDDAKEYKKLCGRLGHPGRDLDECECERLGC